jgi:hypothetical protein
MFMFSVLIAEFSTGRLTKCAVCRAMTAHAEISYVSTVSQEKEGPDMEDIKGSHSTKVGRPSTNPPSTVWCAEQNLLATCLHSAKLSLRIQTKLIHQLLGHSRKDQQTQVQNFKGFEAAKSSKSFLKKFQVIAEKISQLESSYRCQNSQ